MKPWQDLIDPDDVDIISPAGALRCTVKAYYSGKGFVIDDMKVEIEAGDEIRRKLPNGKDEVFLVDDPKFFKNGHFGSHYQVAVSRRGTFASKTGGNYNITVSGHNARLNIASTDNSSNSVTNANLFSDLREALSRQVADSTERANLVAAVDAMEKAQNKESFGAAYQKMIAAAANHMTILAPFLPAITQLLTQFT